MSQEAVKESNSVTGKTVSLVGITDSGITSQENARFLDKFGKVFNSFETSM